MVPRLRGDDVAGAAGFVLVAAGFAPHTRAKDGVGIGQKGLNGGAIKKLVWDTSALLNLKEPNEQGYSPAISLWKDLSDGWVQIEYRNILPAIACFEWQASISRKHRDGSKALRDFYILGDHEEIYPIDADLIVRADRIASTSGFDKLRGADLIFACIAFLENAVLITLDRHFEFIQDKVHVIDLRHSRDAPNYRAELEGI